MLTLIKGGRILDPGNIDGIGDILVEDTRIKRIALYKGSAPPDDFLELTPDKIIDATAKSLSPAN